MVQKHIQHTKSRVKDKLNHSFFFLLYVGGNWGQLGAIRANFISSTGFSSISDALNDDDDDDDDDDDVDAADGDGDGDDDDDDDDDYGDADDDNDDDDNDDDDDDDNIEINQSKSIKHGTQLESINFN